MEITYVKNFQKMLEIFIIICWYFKILVKVSQKNEITYMKTYLRE